MGAPPFLRFPSSSILRLHSMCPRFEIRSRHCRSHGVLFQDTWLTLSTTGNALYDQTPSVRPDQQHTLDLLGPHGNERQMPTAEKEVHRLGLGMMGECVSGLSFSLGFSSRSL